MATVLKDMAFVVPVSHAVALMIFVIILPSLQKNIILFVETGSFAVFIQLSLNSFLLSFLLFLFVVQVECGATITQNNTYFTKPSSFSTGNCAVQVCPGEDICQVTFNKLKTIIAIWYSIEPLLMMVNNTRYTNRFRNESIHYIVKTCIILPT